MSKATTKIELTNYEVACTLNVKSEVEKLAALCEYAPDYHKNLDVDTNARTLAGDTGTLESLMVKARSMVRDDEFRGAKKAGIRRVIKKIRAAIY